MIKIVISILCIILYLNQIVCPPLEPEKKVEPPKIEHEDGINNPDGSPKDPLLNLEYHRYLKEVVNLLETDSKFKNMIENASVDDIKTGKIAEHLDVVNMTIRSQLDELKRREIERLSELISRKIKLNSLQGKDIESIIPKYIDHFNVNTFGRNDLEKLIKQTSEDLERIEKIKREQYREYELEKEYQRRKKLEELDAEKRKLAEEQYQKELEERKHHPKVNHPGSQDQLEEVWTKEDQLDEDTFNPKTFFKLHDTDGDGLWNPYEIDALFNLELDKVYNASGPHYDRVEREAEMQRMREHVLQEMDTDKDEMISYQEFIKGTEKKDFKEDEKWDTLEDTPIPEKDIEEYAKVHHANDRKPRDAPQQQSPNHN